MSFETDRRKMKKIWETSQDNQWAVDSARLVQGKREVQIPFTEAKVVTIGKFKSYSSEWTPVAIKGVQHDGTYSYRAVEFYVELTLPEKWVPYARMNLAYRRTDNVDIFDGTSIDIVTFCQVTDMSPLDEFGLPAPGRISNLKKVRWCYAFAQNKYYDPPPWYDYEMKLFFTLINPSYLTIS
jgi:hypothetical protein